MFKKILFLLLLPPFLLILSFPIFAQKKEETLEGVVTKILEEKLPYQKLEILLTKGSLEGKKIQLETGTLPAANQPTFLKGDEVLISYSKDIKGNRVFYITDFIRRRSLFWLAFIFAVLTIIVGRWRGLTSILAMGVSFLIIFKFILPQILAGRDPVLIAIVGCLLIVPPTFYLSHGLSRKTTVAILATFISLLITGILSQIFVRASRLTGFASEEAAFLQTFRQGEINIQGLLLAGVVISVLGILDDITVSQAAIVEQLRKVSSKLSFSELYQKAMEVGSDHIASMVNTLILVYTGAALPLLLLFINNPHHFGEVINYEIIAEEIVRTLVGSISLVLAVPITTLLAASFSSKRK